MASTPSSAKRPTRGKLNLERQNERLELAKTPSTLGDCIFRLHLVENTQHPKDLILAIIQFTGYTKAHPNTQGQIVPRNIGSDGRPALVFTNAFRNMVDTFLVERKGGLTFFPVLVPLDAGWEGSFFTDTCMSRLVWENLEDEQDIRVNMALLFEAIKNNGLFTSDGSILDLEEANLVKSFDTEECFVCGSSTVHLPSNALIKCHGCKCRFHQHCYAILRPPTEIEHWYCQRCTKLREAKATEMKDKSKSQKRRKIEDPTSAYAQSMAPHHNPPVPVFIGQRDYLIIVARLKNTNVYRSVNIDHVHSVRDFFDACGTAWQVQVSSLYLYLPDSHDVLEILASDPSGLRDALRLFPPSPGNGKVLIRVLLLRGNESY